MVDYETLEVWHHKLVSLRKVCDLLVKHSKQLEDEMCAFPASEVENRRERRAHKYGEWRPIGSAPQGAALVVFDGAVAEMQLIGDEWYWPDESPLGEQSLVTHWMPLPEPPRLVQELKAAGVTVFHTGKAKSRKAD